MSKSWLFGVNVKPLSWVMDGDCIRCTSHASIGLPGNDYPVMQRNGIKTRISRFIVNRRLNGALGGNECRHTCDNSWCINPSHLIHGSHANNMRDMVNRGRSGKGENHSQVKLNQDQVKKIKRLLEGNLSQYQIAAAFGVTQGAISGIKRGKNWRHVQ